MNNKTRGRHHHRPSGQPQAASGPLIALCVGHRCEALRRLAGTTQLLPQLRGSVRRSQHGVLVAANCLGPCAHAAVAAVGRYSDSAPNAGETVWLAGTDDDARAQALVEWIDSGCPPADMLTTTLPHVLAPAVIAVGPPLDLPREQSTE